MNPSSCPLCKKDNPTLYWSKVWHDDRACVYQCDTCGVYFVWPTWEESETVEYYSSYTDHLHQRGVAQNETPNQTYHRRKSLNQYRMQAVKKYIRFDDRVMEIGGGCGNFLVDLIENKITKDPVLIESCSDHLEYAKTRFNIEGYQEISKVKYNFNKIFMFHVLEHLIMPGSLLRNCSPFLNDKGLIVVEVPSSDDPLISLYDCAAYKDFYFQPMHPYIYNKKSLEFLFRQCGYRVVEFIGVQRYSLSNHLQWLVKGIPGGNADLAEALGEECETAYKNRMQSRGTTDTLFGIFQKG